MKQETLQEMQYPLKERIGEPSLIVERKKVWAEFQKWLAYIPKRGSPSRAILARKKRLAAREAKQPSFKESSTIFGVKMDRSFLFILRSRSKEYGIRILPCYISKPLLLNISPSWKGTQSIVGLYYLWMKFEIMVSNIPPPP